MAVVSTLDHPLPVNQRRRSPAQGLPSPERPGRLPKAQPARPPRKKGRSAHFQQLIREVSVGILRTSPSGRCLYANRTWCELIETHAKSPLPWWQWVEQEEQEGVREQWHRALERGETGCCQFQVVSATGKRCGAAAWFKPVINSRGTVTGAFLTVTPLPVPEPAAAPMPDSTPASLAGRTPEGLWEYDFNQLQLSAHGRGILGFAQDALGSLDQIVARIHPEDRKRTLQFAYKTTCGLEGPCPVLEFRILRAEGATHWVSVRVTSIEFNADQKPARIRGTVQVLQEHYGMAQEVQRSARLEETVKLLESFCYSIAHDLRAPLRAMSGLTTALLEDYGQALEGPGLDYAQRIASAATRMDELIEDLLAYGRLSHIELPCQWVNMDFCLDKVLARLEEELSLKQAKTTIAGPLGVVWANSVVLEQVFTNLVTNAIKFVGPDTVPHLAIQTEHRGHMLRIWFQDNGIGIAPAHHERIFRVFERLHDINSYPGTGIGLAIVQKGMDRLGGRVGVESTPGVGSSFWIELPHQWEVKSPPLPEGVDQGTVKG